jgi:galactokinase
MIDARGVFDRLGPMLAEHALLTSDPVLAVRSPARSEIAGNHTDHEGGRVIAGALDRSIECLAVANDGLVARVFSEGHKPVEIALDELDPRPEERVTSAALVRGMAAQLVGTGRTPAGFDLVMASDIPAGGGLSSSAAYELALCRALEALWPGRPIDAVEAAQMAQRVEKDWFGKPCGLMDQLAVSMGGLAYMDFAADVPQTQSLSLDFVNHGFMLCLTDVGCDHSAYTNEYAAVPAEMRAVAQALGGERLADVREESLYLRLEELRAHLGDRMVLRALHYWQEMELVDARWEALCAGDLGRFLLLTERSGASSAMFLQNVSVGGSVRQDAMVALALSTRLLHGRGATRIHGGGFGGSIQAFVPVEELDAYRMSMDRLLGDGACKAYRISTEGAQAQWL